jgi:phosphatidylglycerol:prolipoprotein diacylglycerol transferase
VHFRSLDALAPLGIGLHPTQLYESIGDFLLALFLTRLVRLGRLRPGAIFWTYVLLYGVLRYSVELFRGDDRGVVVAGLYPSQWIAVAAILVAATALIIPLAGHKHASS